MDTVVLSCTGGVVCGHCSVELYWRCEDTVVLSCTGGVVCGHCSVELYWRCGVC